MQWQKVYQHGDFSKIAELCNVEPYVIHRAYYKGIGDDTVVTVMARFFKDKMKRVSVVEKVFGRGATRSSFHDR